MCKKGTRCQVCIGCGRCFDGEDGLRGISFVVENKLLGENRTDSCAYVAGRRLVAVDIGTTTVAMQLHATDGSVEDYYAQVNPQTKYGADVLSRIQAAGDFVVAEDLRTMICRVLEQGFDRFKAALKDGESLWAAIAANTTMVYLLMGYDTRELGQAPFHASHLNPVMTQIGGVDCLVCPGLSAFVGGDIVAGMAACDMWNRDEVTLLIDLGTNGEMVLGNRERMIVCSTAAGPAFEGGVNRGIWGADMIRLLAKLLQEGIMDETGLLADPYFDTGVRVGDVCVTQGSIRAVQLAKGAIRAGIEILTEEYGIGQADIDRVVLAGGFGYYLNPEAAAQIGLLPGELVEKTVAGGNTALAGALKLGCDYLLQGESGLEKYNAKKVEVLNLAQMPQFEELYLGYLNFV